MLLTKLQNHQIRGGYSRKELRELNLYWIVTFLEDGHKMYFYGSLRSLKNKFKDAALANKVSFSLHPSQLHQYHNKHKVKFTHLL